MTKEQRVLDIDLEKLLLGELGRERMDHVACAVEEEPAVQARFLALQADNEAVFEKYPPRVMAAAISERLARAEGASHAKDRRFVVLPAMAAAAATAAALLLYVIIPSETITSLKERPEEIRIKGTSDPALFVFRKGMEKEEMLKSGAAAAAGDVVQLKYAARGASHGVILSIDGRGTVTLHFPSHESSDTRIDNGATHTLAFSYELDDAPRFERFFFVTSNKPINVKNIMDKARRLGTDERGRLALEKGLKQSDFLIRKTARTE